jgi:hypothetical protein
MRPGTRSCQTQSRPTPASCGTKTNSLRELMHPAFGGQGAPSDNPNFMGCKPHLGAPAIRVEIISHPKFFPATKDAGFLFFRRGAWPQSLRFRTANTQIRTAPARQVQTPCCQPARR